MFHDNTTPHALYFRIDALRQVRLSIRPFGTPLDDLDFYIRSSLPLVEAYGWDDAEVRAVIEAYLTEREAC